MTYDKTIRLGVLLALFLSIPLPAPAGAGAGPGSASAPPVGSTILEIPRPVPAFSTRDLDGRPTDWSQLRGKLYLVDFWATWCMPCRDTLPQLQEIQQKYAKDGNDGKFSVLGIAVERTQSGAARASLFAKGLGVTYPLYSDFGSNEARKAFGVNAVPDLYLVDAEGNIVDRWLGSDIDFDDVDATVAAWLAKGNSDKKD